MSAFVHLPSSICCCHFVFETNFEPRVYTHDVDGCCCFPLDTLCFENQFSFVWCRFFVCCLLCVFAFKVTCDQDTFKLKCEWSFWNFSWDFSPATRTQAVFRGADQLPGPRDVLLCTSRCEMQRPAGPPNPFSPLWHSEMGLLPSLEGRLQPGTALWDK